jgi:hypothetical protein
MVFFPNMPVDDFLRVGYNLPVPPSDDLNYSINKMGSFSSDDRGIFWEDPPEVPRFINRLPRTHKNDSRADRYKSF